MDNAQLAQISAAILSITLGSINCFVGYRFFRILLSIWGFIAGAVLFGSIASNLDASALIIVIAALLGGLGGVALVNLLFMVGVFLMGALMGASLVVAFTSLTNLQDVTLLFLIVVAALIGGVLAVWLQRPLLVLATAITGALTMVAGVVVLLTPQPIADAETVVNNLNQDAQFVAFAVWALLAVFGAFYQFRTSPKNARRKVVYERKKRD